MILVSGVTHCLLVIDTVYKNVIIHYYVLNQKNNYPLFDHVYNKYSIHSLHYEQMHDLLMNFINNCHLFIFTFAKGPVSDLLVKICVIVVVQVCSKFWGFLVFFLKDACLISSIVHVFH